MIYLDQNIGIIANGDSFKYSLEQESIATLHRWDTADSDAQWMLSSNAMAYSNSNGTKAIYKVLGPYVGDGDINFTDDELSYPFDAYNNFNSNVSGRVALLQEKLC